MLGTLLRNIAHSTKRGLNTGILPFKSLKKIIFAIKSKLKTMNTLKMYGLSLLVGLVITGVLGIVMLNITMDFRILLFLGVMLYLLGGVLVSKLKGNKVLKACLISIPYSVFFVILVLEEIPGLYFFIPLFIVSSLIGVFFRDNKRKMTIAGTLLTLFMLVACIIIIPSEIQKSLSSQKNIPLPTFSIHGMNGEVVESSDLKGKVIVLDFFGNWCAPCILELKELHKVQQEFKFADDVVFYVINANFGGDTPEKFKRFINKHQYEFTFAYDYNSNIYNTLDLPKGGSLPALMIVDKNQKIRFQHMGFNKAESSLARDLIELIKSYQ